MHKISTKIVSLMLLSISAVSNAEEIVTIDVLPDMPALAKYHQGDNGQSPVILIHGFLQTHDYSTTSKIYDSLAENGYSVLAPTLSYGIKNRKNSLSCDSIHYHSLDGDVAELSKWIKWIREKNNDRPVILIGHSAGSKIISRYINTYEPAPVKQSILVALSHLPKAKSLKLILSQNIPEDEIGVYSLGYCNKYLTTKNNYLSYENWDPNEILSIGKRIEHPLAIILGSADDRIAPFWRKMLKDSDLNIINIEGANHFYDNAHEFDLIEAIEDLLESD